MDLILGSMTALWGCKTSESGQPCHAFLLKLRFHLPQLQHSVCTQEMNQLVGSTEGVSTTLFPLPLRRQNPLLPQSLSSPEAEESAAASLENPGLPCGLPCH